MKRESAGFAYRFAVWALNSVVTLPLRILRVLRRRPFVGGSRP
jgi:hypothetical protein